MDNKKEFKPFIPADKVMPEFTVASVIIGLILAVIFGATRPLSSGSAMAFFP